LSGLLLKISATDADDYDVYYSLDGSGWSDWSGGTVEKDITGTSVKDCDRGTGIQVYYKVIARNSTGGAATSDIVDIWW